MEGKRGRREGRKIMEGREKRGARERTWWKGGEESKRREEGEKEGEEKEEGKKGGEEKNMPTKQ